MGRPAFRLSIALAIAASLGVVAGNGPAGAAAATSVAAAHSPGVDMANPAAVGRACMKVYWGYNTVTDVSRWNAVLRSAVYYTPSYARVTRVIQPHPATDLQWRTWAAHRAVIAVVLARASDGTPPPNTPTRTYLEFSGILTPHGADHWTGPSQAHVAWLLLTRANTSSKTPWLVARLVAQ
jgi:hypothetical protein